MIKLVAIDMDGTLLNSDHVIAPQNIPVIKAASAKGVKVVLSTGRPLPGLRGELQTLGITGADQYVVAFNGSLVQSVTGQVLSSTSFTFDDYLLLESLAHEYDICLCIENDDAVYTSSHNINHVVVGEAYLLNIPLRIRNESELSHEMRMPKCMFIDEPVKIDRFLKNLDPEIKARFNFLHSDVNYIDVMPKSATKGTGLAKLAQHLQIDPSEVMAIGDQHNDLAMLDFAGTAVAMGNGIPEVKQVADFVTGINDEGGVAQAITRMLA
ncbi:Cof-type HAD-IIB family hydrolase [Lapidilactobacillus mulanensis]|uniref:Cof-type HAD-IIB family hydrolase n=1 Tax=Lapidilactobacillus mulanensis TaxID=2485999 RepID=A0ABW4DMD5_9LACO|nr:Cof-type HAD-IIB family hydrolase [Lapidilactobacillus mulanensis]